MRLVRTPYSSIIMEPLEWIALAALIVSSGFMTYNSIQTNKANKQALAQQKELMMEQAPLTMAGYEKAGINPYASDASGFAMSSANTPPVTAPTLDSGIFQNVLGSAMNYSKTGADVKVDAAQVESLMSGVAVNKVTATKLAKECKVLDQTLANAKEEMKLIAAKVKTEGYFQDQAQANTNLLGEKALSEVENRNLLKAKVDETKASQAKILSERDVNKYNLQYILPKTSSQLEKLCRKMDIDYEQAKVVFADSVNKLMLSTADVERVYIGLENELKKLASQANTERLKAAAAEMREQKRFNTKSREYSNEYQDWLFDLFDCLGMTVDELTNIVDVVKLLGAQGLLEK